MSFPGETVTVRVYEKTGRDAYGAAVKEPKEEAVANVLVAPGATADLGEDRPEGVEIAYTLYFPKAYTGDLENADISVRGEWFSVSGSPKCYEPGFCPTEWNRSVEVEVTHG